MWVLGMKPSEVYRKAAEEALSGFAYSFLSMAGENYRAAFYDFRDGNTCENDQHRCLALCFMAAIAEDEERYVKCKAKP